MESLTLLFHLMVVKLCHIIGYQDFGKSKSTYNILLNEKDYFIGDYVCQGINLYSFDEVVNKYQEKLFVTHDLRKKNPKYSSLIRRKSKRIL